MAGIMRLSVKEAEGLADRMEANGIDASTLRETIAEITKQPSPGLQPPVPNEQVSDDVYVQTLREQSPIQEGEGLTCQVCNKLAPVLISGVCEPCFRDWALSTRKE
jgi:hypothetical protein